MEQVSRKTCLVALMHIRSSRKDMEKELLELYSERHKKPNVDRLIKDQIRFIDEAKTAESELSDLIYPPNA